MSPEELTGNAAGIPYPKCEMIALLFWIFLPITIAVWVLRGLGILSFLPGGWLLLLMLITTGSGILTAIRRTAG